LQRDQFRRRGSSCAKRAHIVGAPDSAICQTGNSSCDFQKISQESSASLSRCRLPEKLSKRRATPLITNAPESPCKGLPLRCPERQYRSFGKRGPETAFSGNRQKTSDEAHSNSQLRVPPRLVLFTEIFPQVRG
jgi:hypothetical protein